MSLNRGPTLGPRFGPRKMPFSARNYKNILLLSGTRGCGEVVVTFALASAEQILQFVSNLFLNWSVSLSDCLSLSIAVCLSICLSVCLFVTVLSLRHSLSLSPHLSLSLSLTLSLPLSLSLSLSLSLFLSPSFSRSPCHSTVYVSQLPFISLNLSLPSLYPSLPFECLQSVTQILGPSCLSQIYITSAPIGCASIKGFLITHPASPGDSFRPFQIYTVAMATVLVTISKTGAIVPIANRGICFYLSFSRCLSAPLCLSNSLSLPQSDLSDTDLGTPSGERLLSTKSGCPLNRGQIKLISYIGGKKYIENKGRQRERETERHRDRETERQRETERDRERQRDRETERQRIPCFAIGTIAPVLLVYHISPTFNWWAIDLRIGCTNEKSKPLLSGYSHIAKKRLCTYLINQLSN
eukprot:sb/3465180/